MLPVCRELGIGFVPFSPLGRGFLSGVVKETEKLEQNDVRRRLPRFQEENLKRNIVLVQRLEAMARSKGCSAPQLALAWLLAKGHEIVPIPGTKRRRYLEENVGAMEIALSCGRPRGLGRGVSFRERCRGTLPAGEHAADRERESLMPERLKSEALSRSDPPGELRERVPSDTADIGVRRKRGDAPARRRTPVD